MAAIARPGKDWCEQKKFAGGILFARCTSRLRTPSRLALEEPRRMRILLLADALRSQRLRYQQVHP